MINKIFLVFQIFRLSMYFINNLQQLGTLLARGYSNSAIPPCLMLELVVELAAQCVTTMSLIRVRGHVKVTNRENPRVPGVNQLMSSKTILTSAPGTDRY